LTVLKILSELFIGSLMVPKIFGSFLE